MQIFAQSVVETVQSFLHAGYGSAFPRPFTAHASMTGASIQLDLAEALRLESESLASASFDLPTAALAVGAIAIGAAVLRDRRASRLEPRRAVLALLLVGALALAGWSPAPGSSGARAGPPRYANPELATTALMHGLLADALGHAPTGITRIAHLRSELAFPTTELSAGMKHALAHPELDGWGRPFKLVARGWLGYHRLTSAGPNGRFGDGDDRSLYIQVEQEFDWERATHAFFARKTPRGLAVFLHRPRSRLFRYSHQRDASALTRSGLFDVLYRDRTEERDWIRAQRSERRGAFLSYYARSLVARERRFWEQVERLYAALSKGKPRAPLILIVPTGLRRSFS